MQKLDKLLQPRVVVGLLVDVGAMDSAPPCADRLEGGIDSV
jgi:hypothetical protein